MFHWYCPTVTRDFALIMVISDVFLNLSSKLALKSGLWTHHSCKNVRFKQLIPDPVIRSAFTIDSSTPALTGNLNEHPVLSEYLQGGWPNPPRALEPLLQISSRRPICCQSKLQVVHFDVIRTFVAY
jgi:hypothetical protein